MNNPFNEAENSLPIFISKKFTFRLSYARHTQLRSLAKFCFLFSSFIFYTTAVIVFYNHYTIPELNSDLYNSSFVCHDFASCASKYSINDTSDLRLSTGNTQSAADLTTINLAFVSSLYSEDYMPGAITLGYSIRKHHPNHRMIMMYFPEKVSSTSLCELQAVGWEPRIVERVPPPWEGVSDRFRDQFTKLQMWTYTEFDVIMYVDADTLVAQPLDHLARLILNSDVTGFEFAAAPDFLDGRLNGNFNAGFMVFRPSKLVYDELMRTHKLKGSYDIHFAEQAFLNEYYRFRLLYLPILYNFNISLLRIYPHFWDMFWNEVKLIHYTSQKPFLPAYPSREFKGVNEFWNNMNNEMHQLVDFTKCYE